MTIPRSEQAHYARAGEANAKADDLFPARPAASEDEARAMQARVLQARKILREAGDLVSWLERNARWRRQLTAATASEAAVYRAGYEDAWRDLRDIAEFDLEGGQPHG